MIKMHSSSSIQLLRIDKNKVSASLLIMAVFLTLAGIMSLVNWHFIGFNNKYTILAVKFFDLSTDVSVPTWYSSMLLCVAAILLMIAGGIKIKEAGRKRKVVVVGWFLLSLLFFGLSVDEVAAIHESLGDVVSSKVLETAAIDQSVFHYKWVVSGIIFTAIAGVVFLPFLMNLPIRTRILFIVSGGIFVSGAIGVEIFNGEYSKNHGSWNITYALMTALEEFLEMFGVIVFIYAILEYIELNHGVICLEINPQGTSKEVVVDSCAVSEYPPLPSEQEV